MRTLILMMALSVCLICSSNSLRAANLISNGNFETGTISNWTTVGDVSQSAVVSPPASGNDSNYCVRLTSSSDSSDLDVYDENGNGTVEFGDFAIHLGNKPLIDWNWLAGFCSVWLCNGNPGLCQELTTTYQAGTIYHFNADFRFPDTNTSGLKMDMGYFSGGAFNTIATQSFEAKNYPDGRWQTRMLEYKTDNSGPAIGQKIAVRFKKAAPQKASSPSDKIKMYWTFDEISGTTAHDTAEGIPPLDGTVSGAVWNTGGKYAGCLSFDGSNDYVDLFPGPVKAMDPGVKTWTLSLWFKTAYPSLFQAMANKGNAGSDDKGWMLYMSGGVMYFRVCDSSTPYHAASIQAAVPADGAWHQVVCTVDRSANILKGYLDGNPAKWTTASISTVNKIESTTSFQVGCRVGSAYFKGYIDDVKVETVKEEVPPADSNSVNNSPGNLYVDNIRVYKPSYISGPHGATLTTTPGAPDFDISNKPAYHLLWQNISGATYSSVTPIITKGGVIYLDYFPNALDYVAYSTDGGITFRNFDTQPYVGGLDTCWVGYAFGEEKIFRAYPSSYFHADDAKINDPTWIGYNRDFGIFQPGEPPTSCINKPYSQTLLSARELATYVTGVGYTNQDVRLFYSDDGGDNWHDWVDLPDPNNWSQYLYRLPCLITSPDGDQVMIIAGLNSDAGMPSGGLSRMWLSKDSSCTTWTDPQKMAGQMGGDRAFVAYTPNYATDGRLVVEYRNILAVYPTDPNRFDATIWVGRFDDLAYGRPGQYRIKIWDWDGDWYGGMTVIPPSPNEPGGENLYLVYGKNRRSKFTLSEFDNQYFATLGSHLMWRQKMDETTGNVVSDSAQCSKWGPNPYGSKSGGTWSTGGKYGRCLNFNGTSDYAYAASQGWDGFDPKQRDWSISFWYKTSNRTQFGGLISKGNAGSTDPGYCSYMASGTLYLRVHDNNSTSAGLSTTLPNDSNWHNVVLVISRSTNTMTGYLDGSSSGFGSTNISSLGSVECTDIFREGCRSGPSSYFTGSMDDVRIYDKALTSTDIAAL